MSVYIHDPDATLDYTFDWSAWLDGDTIASATVTASTGLTVDSTTTGADAVTVWVSTDGSVGPRELTCRVTTTAGRVSDRTATLYVEQQ